MRRRASRAGCALLRPLVVAAVCLAGAAPAAAGVDFVVTPGFASSATVGDTGLPASLTIVNTSTQQEGSAGPVTLCAGPDTAVESTCLGDGLPAQSLLLTPACGSSAPAQSCAAGFADPGVFDLAGTATGAAATACAGVAFTISASDQATGQVTLVPASTT